MKNKIFWIISVMSIMTAFSSCKNDDIPDESYYTFTGETMGQYLRNRPDEYSEFSKILQRCMINKQGSCIEALLDSYGKYTCFAPHNEAVRKYLKRYHLNSVEEMTDSAISVIAKMHLVSSELGTIYYTKDFAAKLADQNMYYKTLYINNSTHGYTINEMSSILKKDLLVHNGVIHQIDSVLEPSDLQIDAFLKLHPEYSLFREAVNLTGISTRLHTDPEDRLYTPTEYITDIYGGTDVITPGHRYFYYTCFIETDDTFKKSGIHSLEDMKEFAKRWFLETYGNTPEIMEKGLTEQWTDEDNYFNRFVAYHFVNKKIDKVDFTYYKIGMSTGYEKFQEFTETLAPGQLLYMAAGKNNVADDRDQDRLQLNPSAAQKSIPGMNESLGWTRPERNGIFLSEKATLETSNGLFHEIEQVLTYPRSEFKKIRFRFDYASIFPELMDNGIRAKYRDGKNVYFPDGYLSNIWFRTVGTKFYYLNPKMNGEKNDWSNYQGDEIMALGNFDIDIKLPPVPAGQYEVRFGYSSNEKRGCAQIYMGDSRERLSPFGIPIDLTVLPAKYGWVIDSGTDEDYENDKLLHANGWMKGPNSTNEGGSGNKPLRDVNNTIRCIIGKIDLEKDGNIYLRFRNATTNESAQFMMDYVEVCPSSIYDNPLKPEPRD